MIELEKAKLELKNFLKEHPEAQDFQNKIEEALNSVPEEQRLLVISTMLASSSINLSKASVIGFKSAIEKNKNLRKEKSKKKSNVNDIFDKF